MIGFTTKSGSEYYLNQQKKEISGGKIGALKYVGTPSIMTGAPAVFTLEDGKILKTSTVTGYF